MLTLDQINTEWLYSIAGNAGFNCFDYTNAMPANFDYSGKIMVLADSPLIALAAFFSIVKDKPSGLGELFEAHIKYDLAETAFKHVDKLFTNDKRILLDSAVCRYPLIIVDSEHLNIYVYRQDYYKWFEDKQNVCETHS